MLFLLFPFFLSALAQIQQFNQSQYLGRWYQVYSDLFVEGTFENSSLCDTADYGVYPNSTLSVLNRERQYSSNGPEREIYGWAAGDDARNPGELTVHLQTTGFPAPYWIYQLGPATYNGSFYEYSIVSDPLKLTLFVLARDVSEFFSRWNVNVTDWLQSNGFTNLLNKPLLTQQDNCTYWG